MRAEEIVVPYRVAKDRVEPVSRVRSTLITSSLQALRRRGLEDHYFRLLPPFHKEAIVSCIAGTWLPIGMAVAHYETCDKLPLTAAQRLEIGTDVSQQVQGTVLSTVSKMATGVGVTPWTGLAHFERLWDRLMAGGAVSVVKVGPKEARVEVAGLPLCRIAYFRTAFRGFIVAGCELFAKKVYGHDVPTLCTDRNLGYRFAWA